MKIKEIAKTLGISPNTVKNHRQVAIKKLKEWLAHHIN
jgi:DNA-binding CsgD family transcriptional regulator